MGSNSLSLLDVSVRTRQLRYDISVFRAPDSSQGSDSDSDDADECIARAGAAEASSNSGDEFDEVLEASLRAMRDIHESQLRRAREAQEALASDDTPDWPGPSALSSAPFELPVPLLSGTESSEQQDAVSNVGDSEATTSDAVDESSEELSSEMLDVHSQRRALWEEEASIQRLREERRNERLRSMQAAEAAAAISEAEVSFLVEDMPASPPVASAGQTAEAEVEAAGHPLGSRPQSARPLNTQPPSAAASFALVSPNCCVVSSRQPREEPLDWRCAHTQNAVDYAPLSFLELASPRVIRRIYSRTAEFSICLALPVCPLSSASSECTAATQRRGCRSSRSPGAA